MGLIQSTLLQDQQRLDSASVLMAGLPVHQCRAQVALMPQRGTIDWSFPISVGQLVALGQLPGTGLGCCEHAAALQRVGVDEVSECCLDEISVGQQQRAILVRAIVQQARVLLLDEPCAAIDPLAWDQWLQLMS